MRDLCSDDQQCLKDHYCIHWCTRNNNTHKTEQATHHTFNGVMTKAGSYIDIVIGMMNDMKTPQEFYFMLYYMNKPATKKIKHHEADNNRSKNVCIYPINNSKLVFGTPSGKQDN